AVRRPGGCVRPPRTAPPLRCDHRVDIHVDEVSVYQTVADPKNIAARQIQLAAVECAVVAVHECDHRCVVDLPYVEEGVTQIGDRRTKGSGCCEELGLGAGGGGISEAETNVCRRACCDGVVVCIVDSTDQGPNQADVGLWWVGHVLLSFGGVGRAVESGLLSTGTVSPR